VKIKIHKHTHCMDWCFSIFPKSIRDLGDWCILIWKFEIKIWFKKPYYDHLEILDNGADITETKGE